MIKYLLLIGLGGGIGSIARYLVSKSIQQYSSLTFPFGIFTVNIIGSFLIGFITPIILGRFFTLAKPLTSLITIGFMGGFTTFSTFAYESVELIENGHYWLFFLYAMLSIAISLFAVYFGLKLGRRI